MQIVKKIFSGVIGQLLTMVVLLLVIIFETKIGFNMLYNRQMSAVDVFNDIASSAGKARVSIDTLATYDEVPFTYTDGDVIDVNAGEGNTPVRVQISGALTDSSYQDYGYYHYSDPDNISETVTVLNGDMSPELEQTIHDFWYGSTEAMYAAMTGGGMTANALSYYQCTFNTGNAPMMHDDTANLWYMFVQHGDTYTVVQAPNPFILSDDKLTVHFGDPSVDVPLTHTYSDYETLAAENTIRDLTEENSDGEEVTVINPYVSESDGTDTYDTMDDDKRRMQMVQLGEYTWDANGTSVETTMTVDITSQNALKSQWLLTATTYTYENAGIKISGLTANRSADEFKISGNVNNTLTTERPYVMVLKFIDAKGQLVGIRVLDYRSTKLAPEGVAAFSATIPASEMSIASIASVMFDIY